MLLNIGPQITQYDNLISSPCNMLHNTLIKSEILHVTTFMLQNVKTIKNRNVK